MSIVPLKESRGWGRNTMEPAVCTRINFDEITVCDVFVAFPGAPASAGRHIEIRRASALGKPILLLLEPNTECAFLIRGIDSVAKADSIILDQTRSIGPTIEKPVDALISGADDDE